MWVWDTGSAEGVALRIWDIEWHSRAAPAEHSRRTARMEIPCCSSAVLSGCAPTGRCFQKCCRQKKQERLLSSLARRRCFRYHKSSSSSFFRLQFLRKPSSRGREAVEDILPCGFICNERSTGDPPKFPWWYLALVYPFCAGKIPLPVRSTAQLIQARPTI